MFFSRKLFCCILYSTILLYCAIISAQISVAPRFAVAVGTADNEIIEGIQPAPAGGYYAAGNTFDTVSGLPDVLILKLDSAGSVEWARVVEGSDTDMCFSLQPSTDGGLIAAGYTSSDGVGTIDVLILKMDASGTLEWARAVGGIGADSSISLFQASDGGWVLGGTTTSFGAGYGDVLLLKYDASWVLQWAQTVGTTDTEMVFSVQSTADGGIVAAGDYLADGSSNYDGFIVKTTASGTFEWAQRFGGSLDESCRSVRSASDGGVLAAGYSETFGAGSADGLIIKLDGAGTPVWAFTAGGGGYDYFQSLVPLTGGGGIACGATESLGAGSSDGWFHKLDGTGSAAWTRTGGTAAEDGFLVVETTDDNGIIAAGLSEFYTAPVADAFVIKTDSAGLIDGCPQIQSVSPVIADVTALVPFASLSFVTSSPTVTETDMTNSVTVSPFTVYEEEICYFDPTPTPTFTPTMTPTAGPTFTPGAMPATGPAGIGILLLVLGGILTIGTIHKQ